MRAKLSPYQLLQRAEERYLLASGWERLGADAWKREGVDRPYQFGHAVNAQKHTDRILLGKGAAR